MDEAGVNETFLNNRLSTVLRDTMGPTKHEEETIDEENVYDEEGRQDLVADDELSPEEEGFMRGYEEADSDEDSKDDEDEDSEEKE